MRELLFIALVIACPLLMLFMMRGGHGHGGRTSGSSAHASGHGGCGGHGHGDTGSSERTVDELRRERDELDRLIAQREADEQAAITPIGGGRR